ncbi:MAG TPA: hypothetical protein VL172_16025 [Kofleriaceae bacterium]|nr:hypothetical protein [Kofleriaceae bacterium]
MTVQVSWRRALLHGALVFVAAVLAMAVLSALGAESSADMHELGEKSAPAALFAFGSGLALSHAWQRRRRWQAAMWAAIVVALVAAYGLLAFRHPAPGFHFGTQEKRPLETITENGERRLYHPYLLFSIAHPGEGFVEDTAQEEQLARQLTQHVEPRVYYYQRGDSFLILCLHPVGTGDGALDGYVDGLEKGLVTAQQTAGTTFKRVRDQRSADQVHLLLDVAGRNLGISAWTAPMGAEQQHFIVAAIVSYPDAADIDKLVASYRNR